MKAIALRRHLAQPVVIPPAVDVIVDSAIVLPGRPLFLPDCAPGWTVRLYVAVRVSRLGKGVSAKFAPRYYDSLTLALRLMPQGWPETGGLDGLFDNALALGQWLPATEDPITIAYGNTSLTITPAELLTDEAVATVSTYATIKQGDVIMPCSLPVQLSVALGDTVACTLNGSSCLTVRIR